MFPEIYIRPSESSQLTDSHTEAEHKLNTIFITRLFCKSIKIESIKELAENMKAIDSTPSPAIGSEDDEMTIVDKATVIQWGKKLDIIIAKL